MGSVITAQTKQELELREQFWNKDNPQALTVDVPEKWANESAVILYKSEHFEYRNNNKKMYNPSSFHQRVKLQDKAAVEYFSEFEYDKDQKIGVGFINYSRDKTIIGIKIIKPDGTENILDIEAETILQDDTNKLAIPGLEVGDILDIFVYEDDFLKAFSGYYEYESQQKVLSSDYPIAYRKVAVEVENDYFLNMESFNGAPSIVEEETDRRATRRYVLEARDIEKSDFPRWYYPLTELPAIKFQVVFALKASNESRASVFIADKDAERKTGVTNEEILDYYGERFDTYSRKYVKDVLDYIEGLGIVDKREQMVQALYYIRHINYNKFIELYLARESNIDFYPVPCTSGQIMISDQNRYVKYMSGIAKQLEIDYDIIIATPEYNGSIDDLLIRSNATYGLRFNFDKPLYFFNLSSHEQADYFSKYLEGTKVYKLTVVKNRKVDAVLFDTLPVTTAEENLTSTVNDITFNEDFKTVSVSRESEFSGHFKTEELGERLFFQDYMNEEFEHYGTKHFYNCRSNQNKKFEQIQNKLEALYATFKVEHDKKLKENIKNEFDATPETYDYTVIDANRYSDKPLIVKEDFTINDAFIKKAGANYIVEVGRFIGGQVQIKENEKERGLGVYINNAKSFHDKVTIKIPEGFTVVGLDKLEKNVSNETGSFISTAKVENGTLTYTTKKVYAKRKYTASEWQLMLPWLNAAYEFSQEKVMLKKS
ncbi:hypothetical protein SCB49_00160 [unidentified eubacterium SCB49]|nr:hypothetical protein SCB49_00160 [unidentified eubacterium SCB49]